jgi:hypothetical protein
VLFQHRRPLADLSSEQFGLSQSHIATDSQSVCLGVVPHLGYMTSNLFVYFNFEKVIVLSMWAPSLTRGRVCRLSVSPLSLSVYIYIYTVYVQNIIEMVLNIQYVQGLCQSRLSTADYALLHVAFATTAVLDTWTIVYLTVWFSVLGAVDVQVVSMYLATERGCWGASGYRRKALAARMWPV